MINDETARRMAVRFFEREGLVELAGKLEENTSGYDAFCCEETLRFAVKTLGKVRTRELYERLPDRLWAYFLVMLEDPTMDKRLLRKIYLIQDSFSFLDDSPRPERLKRFPDYIRKMDGALQSYFRR